LNTKRVEVALEQVEAPLWGIRGETSGPGERDER
jgi:hypothetical protein